MRSGTGLCLLEEFVQKFRYAEPYGSSGTGCRQAEPIALCRHKSFTSCDASTSILKRDISRIPANASLCSLDVTIVRTYSSRQPVKETGMALPFGSETPKAD